MKNWLLIAAGFTSLSAGVVGIFVPVLPTTPFFLLAAACFMKSSDRLYRWLTGHKKFGPYIDNYVKYHAVSKQSKVISILVLWSVMLSTILFGITQLWLRLLLVGIAAGVTIHLVLLKTLTPEMMEQSRFKETLHEKKVDERSRGADRRQ